MLRDPCHHAGSRLAPEHLGRGDILRKTYHLDPTRSRKSPRVCKCKCKLKLRQPWETRLLPAMSHRPSPRLRLVFSRSSNPQSTFPRHSTPAVSTQLSSDPGQLSGEISTRPPATPHELALARAGYLSFSSPGATPQPTATTPPSSATASKSAPKPKMAEPRARVARHKGQMNFASERECLYR